MIQYHQSELLACCEPNFRFFSQCWKRLHGKSEGKDGYEDMKAELEARL